MSTKNPSDPNRLHSPDTEAPPDTVENSRLFEQPHASLDETGQAAEQPKRRKRPSGMERVMARRARGEDVAAYVQALPPGSRLYREAWDALNEPERYRLAKLQEARRRKDLLLAEQIKRLQESERIRQQERLQAVRAVFESAPDRVLAAARSHYSAQELQEAGFSAAEAREVRAWRKGALSLPKAAEWLGIPKSRLDRWARAGKVPVSFHRRVAIQGAGTVLARYWRIEDLESIRENIRDQIEKQSSSEEI